MSNNKVKNVLPEGLTNKRTPYNISTSNRILIISDIHIPFHDIKALNKALDYGSKHKIDTLIINGDMLDMYSISRFMKDNRITSLQNELNIAKKILTHIRNKFKKAKIIYKAGNHEHRLQRYLYEHPEMLDLECLKLENLLNLSQLKIKYIHNDQLIKLGKYIIAHGDEIKCSGVNPARTTLLKNMHSIIFSHLHRTDNHTFKTIANDTLNAHAIGCLCDLSPAYAPYNNWNHGFLYAERNSNDFFVTNIIL